MMKKHLTGSAVPLIITVILMMAIPAHVSAQNPDRYITIHLRGVYESKISLLAMSGSRTFKPVTEAPVVKNGETIRISVSKEHLPGECVLRFDYKESETSAPYPSEKNIFIHEQDLELWVNPKYCNNQDSTWFQQGELENSTFLQFSKENAKQKEKTGLLQNFLMKYDDTESDFYRQGITEYEHRRQTYNQWLKTRSVQDKALFVSNLYNFQYIPEISLKGDEKDRIISLIYHYFDGMDFNDPLLIKTSDLNKWMDNYVNLYGQLSTTTAIRDSLFPVAGRTAIEKARQGHPLVYGWMVDYFYRGYESNGIEAGIKILEPYLNDPNCLTSKRQEITRRLKGMETLVAGSQAPDISLIDQAGHLFELHKFETPCRYILLLFWSAGCSHCVEMADNLYPWQQQPELQEKMTVLGIGLDETDADVKAWEQKSGSFSGWKHMRAEDGVRSKVASDYYVLATPVMVLLDATTRNIVATPNTLNELLKVIQEN
ncbi:MAG: thioredoxin-like domain-containing protein [Bacteroidales bacterium]|nr:thioredoxin-like domain-containing protein [Bacteroidales bacterium]